MANFIKIIAGAFVLAVIIYGSVVLWSKEISPDNPERILAGEAHIIMDKDGFNPSEVIIKKGAVVHFINKDSVRHWPASDLHPTHDIYPEFDSKKPVEPGGEWSFVFEDIGSWRMHDHLAPYFEGVIEVVE